MRETVRMVRDPNRLTNPDVATYALWRVGGARQPQDTERIAALCWEMAPSRFSWKHYPRFPDKDIIRCALSDAKKRKNGGLVQGTGEEGWLLTTNGIKWVERNLGVLRHMDGGPTRSQLDHEADQFLRQARQHHLFGRWLADPSEPAEYYDVADIAQLPADAPRAEVSNALSRLENLAEIAGDQEMKEFLIWLRTGTTQ